MSFSEDFIARNPKTYAAALRAVTRASLFANKPENRVAIAEMLAHPRYLNQPTTVLQQVLTGRFADGLGHVVTDPNRINFDTLADRDSTLWLVEQMRRWKMLTSNRSDAAIVDQVFRTADTEAALGSIGAAISPPKRGVVILCKTWRPSEVVAR